MVTSGCVGNLPQVENADTHYAASGIFTPVDVSFAREGIAVEALPGIETVITQDLDTELLRRARRQGTVQTWGDRRRDLYELTYVDPAGERRVVGAVREVPMGPRPSVPVGASPASAAREAG